MKFQITFKDPDGVYDGIGEAVGRYGHPLDLSRDECDALDEVRRGKLGAAIARWVSFSEYVTIEFDTDADTAIVVRRSSE